MFLLLIFAVVVVLMMAGQVQDIADKPTIPPTDNPREQAEMQRMSTTFDCLSVIMLIIGGAVLLLFVTAGGIALGG